MLCPYYLWCLLLSIFLPRSFLLYHKLAFHPVLILNNMLIKNMLIMNDACKKSKLPFFFSELCFIFPPSSSSSSSHILYHYTTPLSPAPMLTRNLKPHPLDGGTALSRFQYKLYSSRKCSQLCNNMPFLFPHHVRWT